MDVPRTPSVSGIPQDYRELSYATGEVTLNYVEGPDQGPPLLLIPGQMESWQGYQRVLPELARRFHVFVPDLRGHGKSTRTPGRYSYNVCGKDLADFLRGVIRKPAIVGGLSSGGVLAIWLAANVPEDVLAVIGEDPPIFSSIWPRIRDERFMRRSFEKAVEILGRPGERDLGAYLSEMGIPKPGTEELLKIPSVIVRTIVLLHRWNRAVRPDRPYDVPFLPFNLRVGAKFLSEYDTDFSRATLDGDLSRDFDPEATLRRVRCPMLLLRAQATRDPVWGLLGAIDDEDLERIRDLVPDLKVVEIRGAHEIHIAQPRLYLEELIGFVDELRARRVLPQSPLPGGR